MTQRCTCNVLSFGRCLIADAYFSELRSVTVWFQNKRQTERKALTSGPGAHDSDATTVGPNAPSRTHVRQFHSRSRARVRSPGPASDESSRTLRTGSQGHGADEAQTPRAARISLDTIASRAEQRTPTRPAVPLTQPADLNADASMSVVELWANTPSSPPTPPSPPTHERDRELIDFAATLGSKRVRRHPTLEYACAAARVAGRVEPDDDALPTVVQPPLQPAHDDVDIDVDMIMDDDSMLMDDVGGDTEGEDEHEAVTPHSSQDSLDARSGARRQGDGGPQKGVKTAEMQPVRIQDPNTEDMEAALVLCGLARLS